mmetsp:Transcript_42303/g.47266  ORF Transcript_42303/g.47266 Transcript_42303/m.47266 type:complete len:424 (+) Transcript_42303:72-1343(+)
MKLLPANLWAGDNNLSTDRWSTKNPSQINENDLRLISNTIKHVLDNVNTTIAGLETDRDLLPSAIIRKCHEFADSVGSLAQELESQSLEERKELANVIREDLRLNIPFSFTTNKNSDIGNDMDNGNSRKAIDDNYNILQALSGASTILRDVENSLRDIGNDEAKDIADTALIVARLFLLSLQSIHTNISSTLTTSDNEEEEGKDNNFMMNSSSNNNNNGRIMVIIEELSRDDDDNDADKEKISSKDHQRQRRRQRVLWLPLGPHVDQAMSWTKEEATKRPLLAAALGLTLWPVTISTTLVGISISLFDGAVQDIYQKFQDGPIIGAVEQSAAQAYQAGRLTVVTSKILGKHTIRVIGRQIDRRGGIGSIVEDIGGIALNRITHPINTIEQVWDGCLWGFYVLKDRTEQFLSMRCQEEQGPLVQ